MNFKSKSELEQAILELEKRKAIQHGIMMKHYHDTTESIKPSNIMRGVFHSAVHAAGSKSNLVKAIGGVGIGLLTRKLLWGQSSSLVKKVLGNVIKVGVAKTAVSNVDKIKAYSTAIYHNLFQKKKLPV